MDKAPDAFRTISEAAEELDVPQHVLRFWETRFAQIKPMKRSGGRRYYRPEDVDLLRGIRHLLYGQGYTIRGVQRILREQGVRAVQAIAHGGPMPNTPTELADARMAGAATDTDGVDSGDIRAGAGDDFVPADFAPGDFAPGEFIPGDFVPDDFGSAGGDRMARGILAHGQEIHRVLPPEVVAPPRREPSITDFQASAAPPPPLAVHPAVVPPPVRLRRDDIRKLEATLHELTECRRLIDAGLKQS